MAKQFNKALIEAQGARRLYSELDTKFVRNGYGAMSQDWFAHLLAQRNAY